MKIEDKGVVISGATGAIGLALVKFYIEREINILAICHKGSARVKRIPESSYVTIWEYDTSSYQKLEKSIREDRSYQELLQANQYGTFYHLAWQGTTGASRNDTMLQLENVRHTLDAVNLANCLGCHTFVGAGSQAEYGRVDGVLSSNTFTCPENGYGIGKLCAGQMSRLLCEQLGMKHIWARILSIYGPGDYENSLIMAAIAGFMKCETAGFTPGMQKWDYLYSEDAARILAGLAQYGRHGQIYCVGSGKTRLLKEYICEIDRLIQDGTVRTEEEIGIGLRPYMNKQVMHLCADWSEWPKELLEELKVNPLTEFTVGVQKTIDWYKQSIERQEN